MAYEESGSYLGVLAAVSLQHPRITQIVIDGSDYHYLDSLLLVMTLETHPFLLQYLHLSIKANQIKLNQIKLNQAKSEIIKFHICFSNNAFLQLHVDLKSDGITIVNWYMRSS